MTTLILNRSLLRLQRVELENVGELAVLESRAGSPFGLPIKSDLLSRDLEDSDYEVDTHALKHDSCM